LPRSTPTDATTLGLAALAATLSDERRAQRFLALTGIGPAELRDRATDRLLLAALIRFLEAHEPDLVAVADALGVSPPFLVQARAKLESEEKR
jgi:hypothetical protein